MAKFDGKAFQREIGLRISIARKCKGITQARLAERIGIGRPQLANVEAGRSRVYVDQIWRAAIVLGISINKLIPERA